MKTDSAGQHSLKGGSRHILKENFIWQTKRVNAKRRNIFNSQDENSDNKHHLGFQDYRIYFRDFIFHTMQNHTQKGYSKIFFCRNIRYDFLLQG